MTRLLKQLAGGKAVVLIIVLGFGGSFQNGFHLTSISSPTPYIQSFINSSWTHHYGHIPKESTITFIWSAVVALYGLGGLIGSSSVKYLTRRLGRKRTTLLNSAIAVVASIIMYISKPTYSFELILIARFLFGFIAGLGLNVHSIYLGESSPKKIRGVVLLTSAIFLALGKLSGQFAGLREILGREEWWNILLCFPSVFCVIQLAVLPFLPDAPRYILIEKNNTEQCRKALQYLWGLGEYKMEIEEMSEEQAVIGEKQNMSVLDLLRDKSVRWQVISLLVLNIGIQFSGISAITIFSFNIFLEAGIPEDKIRYVTLGIGASEVLITITCGLFIERVGRKPLMWRGFGGMSVVMALIIVTLYLRDYSFVIPYFTVFLIFLFMIFYGGGPAATVGAVCNEMFIQSYRPAAFVYIGILRWVGFTLLGFVFPFLIVVLKSLSFVLFSCICLLAALYIFFILPETKGKTILEISQEFQRIRVCGSTKEDTMFLETKL
ncbi:solute carrier family 2 member 9, like 1 isoform X1 [Danio rerio]|uniref:Solute carrier family 2, facilitated glucose transporter member 5 n=4 Tax=Danio rerio TaxID=7955 RepID=F1QZA8_DANRE|nr:solute carrier family 2 member 9, like 1 [Danio rerio]|eukprot:NP_001159589.1 solute carrier family 2 (facilitated glucose transporter), member 9-like 1 [Danio rerio]